MANPDYTAQDVPTWATNLDSMNSLKAIGNIKNPLLELPLLNSLAFSRGLGSLTFARADSSPPGTPATYVGASDGLVKTAGVDTARFDIDGHLHEGESTNELWPSDDFTHGNWTDPSSEWTVVANNQTAPDGVAVSADTITVTGTLAKIRHMATLATGSSGSFWIKVLTGTLTNLAMDHGDGTPKSVFAQLVDGEWAQVKAENMTKGGSDWLDINVTFAASGGTFTIWRGQFEELPLASSGIPTTTAAVTRKADILIVTPIGNMPLASAPQTWLIDVEVIGFNAAASPQTVLAVLGETTRVINMNPPTNKKFGCFWGDASGAVSGAVSTANTVKRLAVVHDGNGAGSYWEDGVKQGTFTGADVTDPLGTNIGIGHTGAGAQNIYGHIRNLRIYGRAFSDREMAVA